MQELFVKEAKELSKAIENEANWFKLFTFFEKVLKGGHKELYISILPIITDLLTRSIQSDRSRLNGIALDFLKGCSVLCHSEFNFGQFIPILFKLSGRANKVFVQRALEALLVVSKNIEIRIVQKYCVESIENVNKNVRFAAYSLIKLRFNEATEFFKPIIERGMKDPAQEVRSLCKEIVVPKAEVSKISFEVKKNSILSLTPRKNFKIDKEHAEVKKLEAEVLKITKETVVRKPLTSSFFEKLNQIKKERPVEVEPKEDELTPRKLDKYLEKYRNTVPFSFVKGKNTSATERTVEMPAVANPETSTSNPILDSNLQKIEKIENNTVLNNFTGFLNQAEINFNENKNNPILNTNEDTVIPDVLKDNEVAQNLTNPANTNTLLLEDVQEFCDLNAIKTVVNGEKDSISINTKDCNLEIVNRSCCNASDSTSNIQFDSNIEAEGNPFIEPISKSNPQEITSFKILESNDFNVQNSLYTLNSEIFINDNNISMIHDVAADDLIHETVFSDNINDIEIIEEYNNTLLVNDHMTSRSRLASFIENTTVNDLSKSFASITIEPSMINESVVNSKAFNLKAASDLDVSKNTSQADFRVNNTVILENSEEEMPGIKSAMSFIEDGNRTAEQAVLPEDIKTVADSIVTVPEEIKINDSIPVTDNTLEANCTVVLNNKHLITNLDSEMPLFNTSFLPSDSMIFDYTVILDAPGDSVNNTVIINPPQDIAENATGKHSNIPLFNDDIFESDNEDVSKKSFVMSDKPSFNLSMDFEPEK